MLKLPDGIQVYVATHPADMRKQADGLSALVLQALEQEPTSGHLFVFFNRQRDRIRILFWDQNGYCVVSKRLERGRFGRLDSPPEDASSVAIGARELAELLAGVELPRKKKPPLMH